MILYAYTVQVIWASYGRSPDVGVTSSYVLGGTSGDPYIMF